MRPISRRRFLRDGTVAAVGLGLGLGIDGWAGDSMAVAASSDQATLDELRRRLHGALLLPGDSGYDSAYAPAKGRFLDIRPIGVAWVADEADVVTCIAW